MFLWHTRSLIPLGDEINVGSECVGAIVCLNLEEEEEEEELLSSSAKNSDLEVDGDGLRSIWALRSPL